MKNSLLFATLHLLSSINVSLANRNSNQGSPDTWLMWGKPFDCKRGLVAVNHQNKNPVKGACIPVGYDINKRPNNDSATKIYLSFNHQKLLKVNERENSFTIDVKESDMWADSRIKMSFEKNYSYLKLASDVNLPAIWMPNAMRLKNMKEVTITNDPFKFTELRFLCDQQISTTSTVLNFTIEYRVTVYCDFQFQLLPFDTQKCKYYLLMDPDEFQLLLYDHTDHSLHATKHYEAHGFDVTIHFHNETNEIGFDVELKRIVWPYILQYYLPCSCIVMVSFISFLVPLSALPGRVGLMVTQFLTLTNIFIHQMVSIETFKAN